MKLVSKQRDVQSNPPPHNKNLPSPENSRALMGALWATPDQRRLKVDISEENTLKVLSSGLYRTGGASWYQRVSFPNSDDFREVKMAEQAVQA